MVLFLPSGVSIFWRTPARSELHSGTLRLKGWLDVCTLKFSKNLKHAFGFGNITLNTHAKKSSKRLQRLPLWHLILLGSQYRMRRGLMRTSIVWSIAKSKIFAQPTWGSWSVFVSCLYCLCTSCLVSFLLSLSLVFSEFFINLFIMDLGRMNGHTEWIITLTSLLKNFEKIYPPVIKEDYDYPNTKNCVRTFCETEGPLSGSTCSPRAPPHVEHNKFKK